MVRYKYLFIGDIPLLLPEKNVSKQVQIYIWLHTKEFIEAIGLKSVKSEFSRKVLEDLRYVV